MAEEKFKIDVSQEDGGIIIRLRPKRVVEVDGFIQKEDGFYWDNFYWGKSLKHAQYHREQFQKFLSQPPEAIKEYCLGSDNMFIHITNAEHFDLSFLENICETALAARRINKADKIARKSMGLEELSQTPVLHCLPSDSILNFFRQPSSRTFLSFANAGDRLGTRKQSMRDISTSSEAKGESEADSFRTFSSYFDAMVYRHPSDNADLFALWVNQLAHREFHILNAGSGKKRHPTQGVLDYYTLNESFKGNLDSLSLIFVGDCYRGRTVHSLAKIMSLHENVTCYFIAPTELQIDEDTERYITERGVKVVKASNRSLKEVIKQVKGKYVVYMTRIQDEHDQAEGESSGYDPRYIFDVNVLDLMPQTDSTYLMSKVDHDPHSVLPDRAILMHPMPKRDEISPEMDYLKQDRRVLYWRQQRNGMWTRVALLAHVFGVDNKIRNYYLENKAKIEDVIATSKTA